jgi:hypothetical protein
MTVATAMRCFIDSVYWLAGMSCRSIGHCARELCPVVATLERGDFSGERALTGHPVRLEAAASLAATTVMIIPKQQMTRLLHDQRAIADRFIST